MNYKKEKERKEKTQMERKNNNAKNLTSGQ